jgi:hypothetical protein
MRLPEEALPHLWFVDVTPQHLDGNLTIEGLVTGKVDDRRTALTEDAQDRVAGQHGIERSARSTAHRTPTSAGLVAWQPAHVAWPLNAPRHACPPYPLRPQFDRGFDSATSTPSDQSRVAVDVDVADTNRPASVFGGPRTRVPSPSC